MSDITQYKQEIATYIGSKENLNTLLQTTFKGLDQKNAEQAMLEGMIRGFNLKDFLEKNVYAIPFKQGYSLVTSIDHSRKIGMRSGVVGKSKPEFEETTEKIISCTITIKKKVGDYIGDFSATVYFDEYFKAGRPGYPSLWETKPRTMIAKVAEMHALRMACPEELSQSYIEEEFEQNIISIPTDETVENVKEEVSKINDIEELRKYYNSKKGLGKEVTDIILERSKELETPEVEPEDIPFPENEKA